jgi:hypothetical protein
MSGYAAQLLSEAAIGGYDPKTIESIQAKLGIGKDEATQLLNQAMLINDNLKLIQALDDHPEEFDYSKSQNLPKSFVTVQPTNNTKDAVVGTLLIDFSPLGVVKDFAEAKSLGDYFFAALGIVPGEKVISGAFKAYQDAKALGDVKGMVNAVNEAKIFTKETYAAPSGRTYNFYGQKIDPDLKIEVKNPKTGEVTAYTNTEWMAKGNNPYVLDASGKAVPTQQHHSQQNADGPIFEIQTTTHQNPNNQQVLHPYDVTGTGKNPYNPVDHKAWNKDRIFINKTRAKNMTGEN